MRISDIKLPSVAASPLTREQLLQTLKPGQILRATALTENLDGQVKLQIGVTRLIAQTRLSVRPGQTLALQVDKTGALPELKLIPQPSLKQVQATALKSILPKQQPLQPLFEQLQKLDRSSDKLPAPLREQVGRLIGQLPSADDPALKAKLQMALHESGLFTESRLLRQESGAGDVKIHLLRLLRLLQGLLEQPDAKAGSSQPPERQTPSGGDPGGKLLAALFRQLDGAIARIQTNQLASLPQEEGLRQLWHFELPLRMQERIDLLQILISRDRPSVDSDDDPVWGLTLRINLPALGPMRFQLRSQGEALSTVIQTERDHTLALVEDNLPKLRQAFEKIGFNVTNLNAFRGAFEPDDQPLPTGFSLLSEKA